MRGLPKLVHTANNVDMYSKSSFLNCNKTCILRPRGTLVLIRNGKIGGSRHRAKTDDNHTAITYHRSDLSQSDKTR